MSQFRNSYRPASNFPPVVKNLIIINVLIWLAETTLDPIYPTAFHGLGAISNYGALFPINSPFFEPYQIVTHMFLHASGLNSIYHVFFNMLILFFVGRTVEMRWGSKPFLIFYLACGLGSAVAHLAMQYFTDGYAPMVGASGAIMGVFVAFAFISPNAEFIIFPFPIPIKAKWLVLIYIGLDLFGGFGKVTNDNIAHFAHLGGALTGFLIVLFWNKNNRRTFY